MTQTLAIDLSTSWTNSSVTAIVNSCPDQMQTVRRPVLWYNAHSNFVYEWGGWPYDDNHDSWLWSFQPDGKGGSAWTQNPAPASSGQTLTAPAGASWVSTSTALYSLGGALVPDPNDHTTNYPTPVTAIQGLVSQNFSSNSWNNQSSLGYSESGYSVYGDASFVPNFGQSGLLVFLGGSTPSNQTYWHQKGIELADFAMIPVLDIRSGAWYHQTATGDIPPGRSEFCQVGVPASDNSSYEM